MREPGGTEKRVLLWLVFVKQTLDLRWVAQIPVELPHIP